MWSEQSKYCACCYKLFRKNDQIISYANIRSDCAKCGPESCIKSEYRGWMEPTIW